MNKQQVQSDKSLTSNSAAAGSVYIFKSTCRADKHFSNPDIFMLNYTQVWSIKPSLFTVPNMVQ